MGWVQGTTTFSFLVLLVARPPSGAIRQVPWGGGVLLREKANLEFLDLIRKELGSQWGGVVAEGGELSKHSVHTGLRERGQHCRRRLGEVLGKRALAKTKNSRRQLHSCK